MGRSATRRVMRPATVNLMPQNPLLSVAAMGAAVATGPGDIRRHHHRRVVGMVVAGGIARHLAVAMAAIVRRRVAGRPLVVTAAIVRRRVVGSLRVVVAIVRHKVAGNLRVVVAIIRPKVARRQANGLLVVVASPISRRQPISVCTAINHALLLAAPLNLRCIARLWSERG